jgi:hypothetical protein
MTSCIPGWRAIVVLAAALLSIAQAPAGVDVAAVTSAAAAYVKAYQTQLTSVVADETYTQQILMQRPNDPAMPRQRQMTSEFFFMFAPSGEWMGIRDVVRVDGAPVKDRRGVLDELNRLPLHEVADAFMQQNSRFNLGRTYRNFNDPTLVLQVLADAHRPRFTFERRRVDRRRAGTFVTLAFAEAPGPISLIRDLQYNLILSAGEFVVDAGSGRIHRGVLRTTVGPVRMELVTEFVPDERLDMLVPGRFRERYEYGTRPTSFESELDYEEIACDARYSNYRRFQTSGRIKKR